MEAIGDILGLLASAASGGLFGILGSLAKRVVGFFETKRDQAFEREKWGHELRLLELQQQGRREETESEVELQAVAGSFSGLAASIGAEAAAGERAGPIVSAIRSLTRPVLTLILVGLVAWIWHDLFAAMTRPGAGDGTDNLLVVLGDIGAAELLRYVVYSVVFAASAAVLWWFGDRPLPPPGGRARG